MVSRTNKTELTEGTEKLNIHQKILAVMKELKIESSDMTFKGKKQYSFVSEAATTTALKEAFVKFGLIMYPEEMSSRTTTISDKDRDGNDRQNILSSVDAVYRIVDVETGESIQVAGSSQGMDMGDKAVNKAATGAYKVAHRQTFMIPSPGREDPDTTASDDLRGNHGATPRSGGGTGAGKPVGDTVVKWHKKYEGKTLAEIWAVDPDEVRALAKSNSQWIAERAAKFLAEVEVNPL